jgi:hypothetical protein
LIAQAADGVNGLVLEQENGIAAAAVEDGGDVLLLNAQASFVVDGGGEMEDLEHGGIVIG